MNVLLRFYPPAWRRRYGEEIAQVLSEAPQTPAVIFDLLRGILDAWLHPTLVLTTPANRGWLHQSLLIAAIAVSIAHPQFAKSRGARNLRLGPVIGA